MAEIERLIAEAQAAVADASECDYRRYVAEKALKDAQGLSAAAWQRARDAKDELTRYIERSARYRYDCETDRVVENG